MAAPFSFRFSGDDIDDSNGDDSIAQEAIATSSSTANTPPPLKPEKHNIETLLSTLPSKIAYNVFEIESPKGHKLLLPRRELFDIRMQLMAEDDTGTDSKTNLDDADLRTNVYEGGFKTWECSFDLARLLLDRGPRKDLDDLCRVDHVVELGCGTAIPTLVLFHYALTQSLPLYVTLTDYNASVLRLVTVPNLLLTYASTLPSTSSSYSTSSSNPLANLSVGDSGDLEITPQLISSFLSTLSTTALNITLVSGSWVPHSPFLSLLPTSPDMNTLVLASETIYSPSALSSFTSALIGILQQVRLGKAMIAAKKIYFGVGGSVDAFKIECAEQKAVAYEIENHGVDLGEGEGVRRCLMEVQML